MKIGYIALILTVIVNAAGCSKQADLEEANNRIAQLESELAAERAEGSGAEKKVTESSSLTSLAANNTGLANPTGEQWIYSAGEDKMTGGTTYHAMVISTNAVSFGSPYDGEQHGRLVLRSDKKYGKEVMFTIERGQILCHTYEDCQILIRFDEGKPETFSGLGPADSSTETVFIRNYERFVGKMRKSKIVRISTNIYQEGAPVFEFDVSSFSQDKYIPKK